MLMAKPNSNYKTMEILRHAEAKEKHRAKITQRDVFRRLELLSRDSNEATLQNFWELWCQAKHLFTLGESSFGGCLKDFEPRAKYLHIQ